MEEHIKNNVKTVLEETSRAFQSFSEHNCVNGDYAVFASMSLAQFREAMHNPSLTPKDLRVMLREGSSNHRRQYMVDEEQDWATFLAGYMAKSSNANIKSSS